jgi:hypothetical protein
VGVSGKWIRVCLCNRVRASEKRGRAVWASARSQTRASGARFCWYRVVANACAARYMHMYSCDSERDGCSFWRRKPLVLGAPRRQREAALVIQFVKEAAVARPSPGSCTPPGKWYPGPVTTTGMPAS